MRQVPDYDYSIFGDQGTVLRHEPEHSLCQLSSKSYRMTFACMNLTKDIIRLGQTLQLGILAA